MKLPQHILLIGTLLITQFIATTTRAQTVKKDSFIPSTKDAITLMKSVCGANNVVKKQGKVFCKICPSFTNNRSSGGSLKSVVYGSFTQLGSREALIDLEGCEPHAGSFGGTVLLRRANNGWLRVRYETGLRSDNCLKFTYPRGRHSLVCQQTFMAQGYSTQWLDVREIGSTKTTINRLFEVESNIGSGVPPYHAVEIKNFVMQDTNKDGRLDLVAKVSETKGTDKIDANGYKKPLLSPPKTYQLTFLFNGKFFQPTPATITLLKQF